MRILAMVLWAAFLGSVPLAASAQCTKDTDCRRNRVCEEGRCVVEDADADEAPRPKTPSRRPPDRDYDAGPARFCNTSYGSCPMAVAIPKGSYCYCPTPYGPIGGIGR